MKIEGRMIVKVADMKKGYVIREDLLIVVKDKQLKMYWVKQKLSEKEIKKLDYNLEKGIKAVEKKLYASAPINLIEGCVYIADLLIIKVQGDDNVMIAKFID